MNPLFTCLEDLPNPGTLIINFLYSPLPTSGNNNFSISSALDFVKLKPEPCGALIITKKAPLSSGAINSFGVKTKRNTVSASVPTKKDTIIFFFFNPSYKR